MSDTDATQAAAALQVLAGLLVGHRAADPQEACRSLHADERNMSLLVDNLSHLSSLSR
jgi:hypothetical protein